MNIFLKKQPNGQQTCEKMIDITNYKGNADQNHNDLKGYQIIPLKMATMKIKSISVGMEILEYMHNVLWNEKWCRHCGVQYKEFSRSSHCGSVATNLTSLRRMQVQSLASLSGLRIQQCYELLCR